MHSKSHNIGDRVIENLFESLFNRCQIGLETSMRSSDFIFHWVHLLHYNCHKIHFKQDGSYINSTDWIKIYIYIYIYIYIFCLYFKT